MSRDQEVSAARETALLVSAVPLALAVLVGFFFMSDARVLFV